MKLQAKFNSNCRKKTEMARLRALLGFCFQIAKKEMPIRMYRIVQTGPNIQLGGLNDGLFNVEYQSGTDCDVNIPAIAPKTKGNAMDEINFILFDLVISYVYFI